MNIQLFYQRVTLRTFPVLLAFFLLLTCLLFTGCASQSVNETAYNYTYNEHLVTEEPLKVLIATRNFGIPSKSYLQKYEQQVDLAVAEQLEKAGYTLIDNSIFQTAWRRAVRKYGSPYDASGASIIPTAFKRVIGQVFNAIQEETDADLILFTDLLEAPVVFSGTSNRRAKWHGVSRTPLTKGGSQLSASFDWSQTVPAASLRIIIYTRKGELLLKNIGGLEVVKQLDIQRERFVRRDKLFTNNKNLEQGVSIALHPLILLKQ